MARVCGARAGARPAHERTSGLFFAGWIVEGAAADSGGEALFGHADASALAHAHAPGAVPLYAAALEDGGETRARAQIAAHRE